MLILILSQPLAPPLQISVSPRTLARVERRMEEGRRYACDTSFQGDAYVYIPTMSPGQWVLRCVASCCAVLCCYDVVSYGLQSVLAPSRGGCAASANGMGGGHRRPAVSQYSQRGAKPLHISVSHYWHRFPCAALSWEMRGLGQRAMHAGSVRWVLVNAAVNIGVKPCSRIR